MVTTPHQEGLEDKRCAADVDASPGERAPDLFLDAVERLMGMSAAFSAKLTVIWDGGH